MDFNLSEEHRSFADSVRRFAHDKLAAGALQRAHSAAHPADVARLLADQGLLGIAFAEADGGQGGSLMHAVLAIQEVALVCPKSADIVQAGNFGPIRTFVEYATPEQKERWLPDLLSGRQADCPGHERARGRIGRDRTHDHCHSDGEHYVINGSKVFSTHSPDASAVPGLRALRPRPATASVRCWSSAARPASRSAKPSAFMSGEQWCQLYIDNCRIPLANLLLGPGGFKKQISGFNVERLGNASRSLALGRLCYNLAREHVHDSQAVRPAAVRVPGHPVEVRRHGAEARVGAVAAVQGRNGRRAAACPPRTARRWPSWRATRPAGTSPTRRCRPWEAWATAANRIVEYCVRRIRGWMIAGGSIEMLKNRIAEGVFERSFSQRPPKPA